MKPAITALAAALLFVGCQEEQSKPSMSSGSNPPMKAETAKPAMSSEAAKTASTAKPASAKEYYEVKKNGKTYVFGSVDAMANFRSTGIAPAGAIEKNGPNGEPVVYEAGNGMEAGLMAEYNKSHPKK
jgi:hypothetical protein